RPHLKDLLEGAEAAGEGEEGVSEIRHPGFALVHRGHDVELGQRAMSDLTVPKGLRNDSDRLAAGGEDRIRDIAHQAHLPSTIDKADASRGQDLAELDRRVLKDGLGAATRP